MHQRLFGVGDGLFHRLKLLSDVEAATLLFQHGDNTLELAFGTLEPLDDFGVGAMRRHFKYLFLLDRICPMLEITCHFA